MGTPRATPPGPGPGPVPTEKKPNKVTSFAVKGGPRASKFRFSWKAPSTAGNRPVKLYRLTIQVRGKKPVVIKRNLSKNKRSFTLSRKALLRATFQNRGEDKTNIRYVAKIRAVNSRGSGPIATRGFAARG